MNKLFIILTCFLLISLSGYSVSIKILPFMEVKGDEYFHNKEELSVGASYSIGGLLRFLTGYKVDYEYTNINYTPGNLDEAISNNPGYDMYMWVEYRKLEGNVAEYSVKIYGVDKREILKFNTRCNYNDVNDIFNMIDDIVLEIGSKFKNMNIKGFGTVRISFESVDNKVYRVLLNNSEIISVTNDMSTHFRIFSDVEYELAIEMKEGKSYKVMNKTNITLGKDEVINIAYKPKGKVIVGNLGWKDIGSTYEYKLGDNAVNLPLSSEVLGNRSYNFVTYRDGKKVYYESFYVSDGEVKYLYPYDKENRKLFSISLGIGSKGMANIGDELFLSESFRIGSGIGISVANLGNTIFTGSIFLEGRYYTFRVSKDIILDSFLGIGGNLVFFPEFSLLDVISSYLGLGIEVWKIFLDVGAGVGFNVKSSRLYISPHAVIGIRL